jgi:deoxyadenosine/deoxycytidine kinase
MEITDRKKYLEELKKTHEKNYVSYDISEKILVKQSLGITGANAEELQKILKNVQEKKKATEEFIDLINEELK